jgi:hypothetical protein
MKLESVNKQRLININLNQLSNGAMKSKYLCI